MPIDLTLAFVCDACGYVIANRMGLNPAQLPAKSEVTINVIPPKWKRNIRGALLCPQHEEPLVVPVSVMPGSGRPQ